MEPRKFASGPRAANFLRRFPRSNLDGQGLRRAKPKQPLAGEGSSVSVRFARCQAGRECSLRITARTGQREWIWENWPVYGVSQSTKRKSGILWKSEVLWVTRVKSKTKATEAINRSAVGTSRPLRRS